MAEGQETVSARIVPPWRVLPGMQKLRKANAREELTFAEAWKLYQKNTDNRSQDGVSVVDVAAYDRLPHLLVKDIPNEFLMDVKDELSGRQAYEKIVMLSNPSDDQYLKLQMDRWDAMNNSHHIPHATLTTLGIPITGPDMFRFQPSVEDVAESTLAPSTQQVSVVEEEVYSSGSDEERVIITGKPKPIKLVIHQEQDVPMDMDETVSALESAIEDADVSGIPNDLEIDDYERQVISGDPDYRPVKCKIRRNYGWEMSESAQNRNRFSGVSNEFLTAFDTTPDNMRKLMIFVNEPALVPRKEWTGLLDILETRKANLRPLLMGEDAKEDDTVDDVLGDYQELKYDHPDIETTAQVALVFATTYPERANPVQIEMARFAHGMMMGSHQGHRVAGGDMYQEEETYAEGDLLKKMRQFKSETDDMWTKLRSRPTPLVTQELKDVEQDLEIAAEDTSETFTDKLRNAGEYLKNVGSKIGRNILDIGKKVKQEMKRVANLMDENTPAATEEAQHHMQGLRNWISNARSDISSKEQLMKDEEHLILAEAEKNLDLFEHKIDRFLMATKVDSNIVESVGHTSKIIEKQTVTIPNLETGDMLATSRKDAVLHIHKMINRLQWYFYNEQGVEKYRNPYELSLFMSFLGNICQSSEVKDVSEFSTLKSDTVWFSVPEQSSVEQYRFFHDVLARIDLLLQESFKNGTALGTVIRAQYDDGLLTPEDIDNILSAMNYIGTLAMDPIRAQRTTGNSSFHNNNKNQMYEASYGIYKDKLRFTSPQNDSNPYVSARRLAQTLNVCNALLKISPSDEDRQALEDDRTYYLAVLYSNHKAMVHFAEHELGKFYGQQALGSSSESFDSSGTDSSGGDSDGSLEQEVSRATGAGSSSYCIEGNRALSPCVTMGPRHKIAMTDVPAHRVAALSKLSERCSNWHDFSHVLDHLGIRARVFS